LKTAANDHSFGLRADGRFYPYSTPQGRRIAWRQAVWSKHLYSEGYSKEDAEVHLRESLAIARAFVTAMLASRQPSIDFDKLDVRQEEALLDLAHTQGVKVMPGAFVEAVLASDWERISREHLYVRYAGHAPDHPRNKAFAQRFLVRQKSP
jgi:hypothetical protein